MLLEEVGMEEAQYQDSLRIKAQVVVGMIENRAKEVKEERKTTILLHAR